MKHLIALSLLLCLTGLCLGERTQQPQQVHIRLLGSSHLARSLPLRNLPTESHFYRQSARSPTHRVSSRGWYQNIYPGIDLVSFGDDYSLEYIFVLSPGADVSLIRFMLRGAQTHSCGHAGNITFALQNGEVIQSPPVMFLNRDGKRRELNSRYNVNRKGHISIRSNHDPTAGLNGTTFSIVPQGGQPGGPLYTFFMSKYETTHDQILRFLNDAERNQETPRGENMFFGPDGNVWINPAMKSGRDELFGLSHSQFVYDPDNPAGERYAHRKAVDGSTPFANHPATGLSWFGGLKYANWLTLEADRGLAQRCYQEGTNTWDWFPVTATNWAKGEFDDEARALLLSLKGFRLPMVNGTVPEISTNLYNEFYKAAAWDTTTNRHYAFGRDTCEDIDANSDATERHRQGYHTLPVGYFDGENFLGEKRTHPNNNLYGLYDLSGNVAEWMNDLGHPGNLESRIVSGGSWNQQLDPVGRCRAVPPYSTTGGSGFRSATTYLPDERIVIHVLFSFFMQPTPLDETLKEDEAPVSGMQTGQGTPGATDRFGLNPDTSEGTLGLTYKEVATDTTVMPSGPSGPSDPGPVSPPVIITTNTLTVQSFNPNSNVPITITDTSGSTSVLTTYSTTYLSTETVQLSAPATSGGNSFVRWIQNGTPLTLGQQIVTIAMSADTTMIAQYVSPILNVTLGYSPNSSGFPLFGTNTVSPGETNWLVAITSGGSGLYTYSYEFKFEHHTSTFANVWVPATNTPFVDATNLVWFYKDVRFRVTVDDGFTTLLSNEALLNINPFTPWPHPGTRVRP